MGRGCPCIPALVRIRNTHAQAKLPHDERAANVAGAFALRPGAAEVLSGRRVLLVDDVVTTGATIGGCRERLRAAGAEVLCAAFTVTAGGGDSPLRFGKNSI